MSVKMEAAFEKPAAGPEEDLRAHGSGDRERHGSGRHTPLLHAPAGPMSGTAGFVGGRGWFGEMPVLFDKETALKQGPVCDGCSQERVSNAFRQLPLSGPAGGIAMLLRNWGSPMPFGSRPSRDPDKDK